ncbi:MAG: hypothetical protein COW30_15265 [Rhodospirillales bacterium CG15_BIG_FIL_POST_REV_8_21_14_020_66_15]|nr:MAG: hypothetical protein COW30_15265 [Rhodospirillales bacterium CG15_BIG_FIL_POST_REV_8_21_14_020_66_15]
MVVPVWEAKAELGEGPIWDERNQCLIWLDVKGRKLHVLSPVTEDRRTIPLSTEVGAVALRRDGGLVAATRAGFAYLDAQTGGLAPICDPERHLPGNRFNDGNCDPGGRFIAGSMDDCERQPTGNVYALEPSGEVCHLFGRFVVCNGPAFSPGGDRLYFSDSVERTILAFDYDVEFAAATNPRCFARFSSDDGFPDGLTVDAEGGLWVAHWDGWRVTRFLPDGTIDQVIPMPVPRPTRCAFGGPELKDLFVTSARIGLSPGALAEAPLSGALFRASPGTTGLPAHRFNG